MCISCICGASMVIILFIPESLHWHIRKGDRIQFKATMREAAAQNGTDPVNLEVLVPEPRLHFASKDVSVWNPWLRYPTIFLILSWAFLSFIYYGRFLPFILSFIVIRLYTGINFAVLELDLIPCHPFWSISLVGLVEIPAYLGNW